VFVVVADAVTLDMCVRCCIHASGGTFATTFDAHTRVSESMHACNLFSEGNCAKTGYCALTNSVPLTLLFPRAQKYDFIINKLVAAVDAEFTLLNNKLALSQQFPSSQQPQSPEPY
jgi:hypothetical protein